MRMRRRAYRRQQSSCNEVKQGHVAVPENFLMIQQFVDKGGNPWRLNPVETAERVGIAHLGFSPGDKFVFRSYYVDYGSGLNHALVDAQHGICKFLVELYQPVRQGGSGIWAVQRVTLLGV